MSIIYVLVMIALYFVPTILAVQKKHINKEAIILINIFLGWTFIGWFVALIWAIKK